MGRVSLTEDYDDRSVISKLNEMDKRVKENTTAVTSAEASARPSAQAAQETADRFAGSVGAVVQNANAQINASKAQVDQAKAEVDETVTTVAQAVQTANNASASAQQSANTVATYDDRLTATETKNSQQDTDIAGLQTADGQNVKINRINDYAVGLTGNQDNITGIKTFVSGILNITSGNPEIRYYDDRNKTNLIAGVGVRFKTATSTNASIRSYAPKIHPTDNNEIQRGGLLQLVSNQNGTITLNVLGTKADGSLASKVIASFDGTAWN